MKTKKLIALFAVIGLSIGLAGCGNNNTKPEAKSEPTKKESKNVVKPEEERTTQIPFDDSDSDGKSAKEIRQSRVVELNDIKDTEFSPEQMQRYESMLSRTEPPINHFGIPHEHTSKDIDLTFDIVDEINSVNKTIDGTGSLGESRIIKQGDKSLQVLKQKLPLMYAANEFINRISGTNSSKNQMSKDDRIMLYTLVPSLDENGKLPFETGESDCTVFDKFIASEYVGGSVKDKSKDFGFPLIEANFGRDDIWRCKETGEEYQISVGRVIHFQKDKNGEYQITDMKSIDGIGIMKNPLRKRGEEIEFK